jgi:hypothetical protein
MVYDRERAPFRICAAQAKRKRWKWKGAKHERCIKDLKAEFNVS